MAAHAARVNRPSPSADPAPSAPSPRPHPPRRHPTQITPLDRARHALIHTEPMETGHLSTFPGAGAVGDDDPTPLKDQLRSLTPSPPAPALAGALAPATLADRLRAIGFNGAWAFITANDPEVIAVALAEIEATRDTGQRITNPPGLLRYLVRQHQTAGQEPETW